MVQCYHNGYSPISIFCIRRTIWTVKSVCQIILFKKRGKYDLIFNIYFFRFIFYIYWEKRRCVVYSFWVDFVGASTFSINFFFLYNFFYSFEVVFSSDHFYIMYKCSWFECYITCIGIIGFIGLIDIRNVPYN